MNAPVQFAGQTGPWSLRRAKKAARLESGLLGRQIGCKVLMKLCRVKIIKTVCRLLYGTQISSEITSLAVRGMEK